MLVRPSFTASKDTKGQRETSGTREVAPGHVWPQDLFAAARQVLRGAKFAGLGILSG